MMHNGVYKALWHIHRNQKPSADYQASLKSVDIYHTSKAIEANGAETHGSTHLDLPSSDSHPSY